MSSAVAAEEQFPEEPPTEATAPRRLADWWPWIVFALALVPVLVLGLALRHEQRESYRLSTGERLARFEGELALDLQQRVNPVARLAGRLEDGIEPRHLDEEARRYFETLPSLRSLSWQRSGDAGWTHRTAAGAGAPSATLERAFDRLLVEVARAPATASGVHARLTAVGASPGGAPSVAVAAAGTGGEIVALFDAGELLGEVTRHNLPGYGLAVGSPAGSLLVRAADGETADAWRRETAFDAFDAGWSLAIVPPRAEAEREISVLWGLTTLGGTLLAGFLAAALLQTRNAHRSADEARAAHERIAEEMRLRSEVERELQRSNAELERFAYVASHDLQEPLRQVASFCELLERRYRGRLDSDADEFIGYAVSGARRMQRLIQDLLAYSRVGTRGGEPVPVSAEEALAIARSNLEVAIAESGAEVTSDPLPAVLGDRPQLVALFQNLVGNALKFRRPEEPPRVQVAVAADAATGGARWRFSVSDNGIGIEPQYFERIFVIFQRLHGREDYPGTGIGLALVQRIVERHGGQVEIESEPGRGSTFHFTLPAAPGGSR